MAMSGRPTRADRAKDIHTAIGRFEQGAPTGDHDGRLIDENLGTEAGFGGSAHSRRQQIQQYFQDFPFLRHRWRAARDELKAKAGEPPVDPTKKLNEAQGEAEQLREQLRAMDRVADLLRLKAQQLERRVHQLERQLQRQRADGASPANIVQLRPEPDPPSGG